MEQETDPFGPEAHDTAFPEHSGKHGHYCNDWDGLWICEDCEEFSCCLEYPEVEKKPVPPYKGEIPF